MPRKLADGQVSKTENLTLRINAKLKYVLELVARKQHRNLSEVTSWCIEQALIIQPEGIKSLGLGGFPKLFELLWSPYESDRLVLLATAQPDLLTFREDVIWRYIKEDKRYLKENSELVASPETPLILVAGEKRTAVDIKAIRKDWQQIKHQALQSVAVQSSQVT